MAHACLEIETTRDIAHSKLLGIEVLLSKNLAQRYADPIPMGDTFTTQRS